MDLILHVFFFPPTFPPPLLCNYSSSIHLFTHLFTLYIIKRVDANWPGERQNSEGNYNLTFKLCKLVVI